MFKRKLYSALLEWKSSSKGKTALLIEGAQREGKSTIPEEFGKHEYGNRIVHVEAKSSNCRNQASLDWFSRKYCNRVSERIIVHTKDLSSTDSTLY